MEKAFLGTGLLGSAFITALCRRNEKPRIWNRTPAKALRLQELGAIPCSQVADAVANASIIHMALKDDASVDEVLQQAAPALAAGATIIDHTTTTKEGAIRRTAEWKAKGFTYMHAPVFMGPANALDATGFMLVSGSQEVIEKWKGILEPMTGQLLNLGAEEGKAAAMKLAGNAFLVCFTFSLRETLAVARSLELEPKDLFELFGHWNPAMQLLGRLKRLTTKDVQPSWELAMARKDTGLFLDAAEKAGIELSLLPQVAEVMDAWIGKGFGGHDWTVVGQEV